MSETQNPNELMGAAQDIAPLAWVIDEIRGSLNLAIDGVKVFVANKQDGDALKNARNQVHQAHGALQLLDLRGVALATEAIEQLLRRWESEPKECGPSAVRTVETAVAAIIAEAVLEKSPYKQFRKNRYASFDVGAGAEFEGGRLKLEDLREYALTHGEPKQSSGKQEWLENIINSYI